LIHVHIGGRCGNLPSPARFFHGRSHFAAASPLRFPCERYDLIPMAELRDPATL
jgi:hypothetical protein